MIARRTYPQNTFYFFNLSNINLPRDGGSDEGGTIFGEADDDRHGLAGWLRQVQNKFTVPAFSNRQRIHINLPANQPLAHGQRAGCMEHALPGSGRPIRTTQRATERLLQPNQQQQPNPSSTTPATPNARCCTKPLPSISRPGLSWPARGSSTARRPPHAKALCASSLSQISGMRHLGARLCQGTV